MPKNEVLIIDFGSQVTQLIARRVREYNVFSRILPASAEEEIKKSRPKAVILSGGPASVAEEGAPRLPEAVLSWGAPILGICYGMQLLAQTLGGELAVSNQREYGPTQLIMTQDSPLWKGIFAKGETKVVMSHGDRVRRTPPGFKVIAKTSGLDIAAMADEERKIYGLQFHPEVHHSEDGSLMLQNFLDLAGLERDWRLTSFIEKSVAAIKSQVGGEKVICGLSGGIDSTVTAALVSRAIGDRLHCLFVDNGLLRQDEDEEVSRMVQNHMKVNFTLIKAGGLFLKRLAGVEDPEQKRKIIGRTFIEVFEREARENIGPVKFLAQGTLYPDVIESVSTSGPSAVIKSHHNVGGLPESMNLSLVEPLRDLFKDEVRKLAAELGLPDSFIWRQPFPGPGLAIRLIGPVSEERLAVLRRADAVVREELAESGWDKKTWQGFVVLLPLKTVGVMGDSRSYENVAALRVVTSVDAMTAEWARLPYELLDKMAARIINEVAGINRVVYDISSKPPSTIEWE